MINKTQHNKIPEGWKEKELNGVGTFSKGKGILKKELSPTGHNAIRYGELYTKHHIKVDTIYSFISDQVARKSKLINQGDIIFAGSGETIDEIGKSAVYLDNEPCYVGGDTLIFSSNRQDNLYLAYLLNNKVVRKELRKLGQGQSVVHLYQKDLSQLKILLPPLPEQKGIVSVLETWDKYIELLDKKIEIKKNIKKYLMQILLTGKVRLKGFDDEWRKVKLKEICESIKTGKLDANAMSLDGRYHFYTCAKDYYYINTYAFDTEALLVSGNGENVGYIHYYKGRFNAYQRTYVLDKFTENILFLKYLLQKNLPKRIYEEKCDGNTPYIKMETLKDMMLEIPNSKDEQKAISSILSSSDKEIEILEQEKKLIEEQKKYLLNNLVTGKIRIPKFVS